MTPEILRGDFRQGKFTGPTAGLALGYTQANIAIVPQEYADEFQSFLTNNAAACPFLARSEAGRFELPTLGDTIDIRSDLPLYRVYRDGAAIGDVNDIKDIWRTDLVTFAIGCSLSFEADLADSGVDLRCMAPGKSCSAFDTNIPNQAAGRFGGNLIVSMRAVRNDQLQMVIDLTGAHPDAHGAPVHTGDPAIIGVDLDQPIDGIGLIDIQPGETPVFWACGVTMERALKSAKLPFAITHAPGHMLITDRHAKRRA